MSFDLDQARQILERTPEVLRSLLEGLDEEWIHADEGPDTWSAFDVVGHLIHGDQTDWIARAKRILEHGTELAFEPFDRFAQEEESRGKTLGQLLDEFAAIRRRSLEALAALDLSPADYEREGMHPALGKVTLGELLATWVTHDLGHVAQISRVLAKRYAGEIGPWTEYIPVVSERTG